MKILARLAPAVAGACPLARAVVVHSPSTP